MSTCRECRTRNCEAPKSDILTPEALNWQVANKRKGRVDSISRIESCMLRRYGKESYYVVYSGALAVHCDNHCVLDVLTSSY